MNINQLITHLEQVILGKTQQLQLIIATCLAGGHVLLEDYPGTGKTVLAKSLATSLDVPFSRIQFTPDMLPSELVGLNFFNPKTSEFTFKEGSLFASLVLADEINRATPRTQAGLLESMEEGQITVDGLTHHLPKPYFVIATQNPLETHGTFPLPEAQLDRFMTKLSLGYPSTAESIQIAKEIERPTLQPICNREQWLAWQQAAEQVHIADDVYAYLVALCEASRAHQDIAIGISTRGILALARLVKAYAYVCEQSFVKPDTLQTLAPFVFAHRLVLKVGVNKSQHNLEQIVSEIIQSVPVPTEQF